MCLSHFRKKIGNVQTMIFYRADICSEMKMNLPLIKKKYGVIGHVRHRSLFYSPVVVVTETFCEWIMVYFQLCYLQCKVNKKTAVGN